MTADSTSVTTRTTLAAIRAGHEIRHGAAVIPWARAIITEDGGVITPAGWALPGGARTSEPAEALTVANIIDAITERHRFAQMMAGMLARPVGVAIAS